MKWAGTVFILGSAVWLGACGSVETCEEPEFYELASGGKRIDAPEDLDGLEAGKEMVIPEASPRPPRDRTSGCLDRPPTLNLDDPEEEDPEEG